jgi:hypothetical protein
MAGAPYTTHIKPFAPARPQTAREAVRGSAGTIVNEGLTRDQLAALRQHVKQLATDKLALLQAAKLNLNTILQLS